MALDGTSLATKISQDLQSDKKEFLQVNNEPIILQTEKTTDPLDEWLLKLSKKENCPREGMIDSNGKKSYSALCFQLNTFKGYVKKYNLLPHTEDYEIINMIDDRNFQFKLAKMMIQDDYNNHNHWKNAVKKIGLPPKI